MLCGRISDWFFLRTPKQAQLCFWLAASMNGHSLLPAKLAASLSKTSQSESLVVKIEIGKTPKMFSQVWNVLSLLFNLTRISKCACPFRLTSAKLDSYQNPKQRTDLENHFFTLDFNDLLLYVDCSHTLSASLYINAIFSLIMFFLQLRIVDIHWNFDNYGNMSLGLVCS